MLEVGTIVKTYFNHREWKITHVYHFSNFNDGWKQFVLWEYGEPTDFYNIRECGNESHVTTMFAKKVYLPLPSIKIIC